MRQIVISVETTGEEPSQGHRLIEIGCVEMIDEIITSNHFHMYFNPDRGIDDSSLLRHGVSREFLVDKPRFHEVIDSLKVYIANSEIIAFNANFVLSFLNHEIALLDESHQQFTNSIIDVLDISNKRHPNQNNSLENLRDRYFIDNSKKEIVGTLYRAEIVAEIFLSLINKTTTKITSDLSKFITGDNLTVVESFKEFDAAIDGISKTALCRGVSNHEYALLPSLFRHQKIDDVDIREQNLMWVFKTHAKAHLENIPESEIEWLSIAQHHGLPTRLLDWSLSPLVACYFAVQNLSKKDAAVYVYDVASFKKEEDIKLSNLKEIVAFFPSHATKRVTAQSGMFTVHPNKSMKLESKLMKKILIPSDKKKNILEKLTKYGIHSGTIFPDLDGLSNYIRYLNGYK